MRASMIFLTLLGMAGMAMAQTKTLDVYVIDVEGGNAVLFVSPTHETLLMGTGNVGAVAAPRDAARIVDALGAARTVSRVSYPIPIRK